MSSDPIAPDAGDILGKAAGRIMLADNMAVLAGLPDDSIDLVYIDPPFNTGKRQSLESLRTTRDELEGDRTGFGGHRYRSKTLSTHSYLDVFDDYLAFLKPRLWEIRRVLKATGTMYLHLDAREVHYAKVLCDQIFGRDCFLNEVIWAYDYGARSKSRWPAKHDNILVYVKDTKRYFFDIEAAERIPYMAPGLVGPEKAARGKTLTDVHWQTIVPPGGKERTGYPTQKPVALLKNLISASCPPGGIVADFFAGAGTAGAAAASRGCRFLLVDSNPEAFAVMVKRLGDLDGVELVEQSQAGKDSK